MQLPAVTPKWIAEHVETGMGQVEIGGATLVFDDETGRFTAVDPNGRFTELDLEADQLIVKLRRGMRTKDLLGLFEQAEHILQLTIQWGLTRTSTAENDSSHLQWLAVVEAPEELDGLPWLQVDDDAQFVELTELKAVIGVLNSIPNEWVRVASWDERDTKPPKERLPAIDSARTEDAESASHGRGWWKERSRSKWYWKFSEFRNRTWSGLESIKDSINLKTLPVVIALLVMNGVAGLIIHTWYVERDYQDSTWVDGEVLSESIVGEGPDRTYHLEYEFEFLEQRFSNTETVERDVWLSYRAGSPIHVQVNIHTPSINRLNGPDDDPPEGPFVVIVVIIVSGCTVYCVREALA